MLCLRINNKIIIIGSEKSILSDYIIVGTVIIIGSEINTGRLYCGGKNSGPWDKISYIIKVLRAFKKFSLFLTRLIQWNLYKWGLYKWETSIRGKFGTFLFISIQTNLGGSGEWGA